MTAKEDGPTLAGSPKLDVISMDFDQELWQMSPDAPITLPKGGVDVWLIHLERSNTVIAALETLLNDSERRRAYRYFTEGLKEHYVVRRGRLRRILSYYLGKTPESIQFQVDSHGKLSFHEVISFNISNSGDYALGPDPKKLTRSVMCKVDLLRQVCDSMQAEKRRQNGQAVLGQVQVPGGQRGVNW